MNQEYILAASRTESRKNPRTGIPFSEGERKRHSRLGIITEIAELLDIEKKHTFYGEDYDKDHAMEELGDLCWYLALGFAVCKRTCLNDIPTRLNDTPSRILELTLRVVADETLEFSERLIHVYIAARSFADEMEFDWDEVLRKNQAKLEARYKGKGFTAEEAINRDTAQEKEAMQ